MKKKFKKKLKKQKKIGITCLPLLMVVEREMQIDQISILTNLLSVVVRFYNCQHCIRWVDVVRIRAS